MQLLSFLCGGCAGVDDGAEAPLLVTVSAGGHSWQKVGVETIQHRFSLLDKALLDQGLK